MGAYHHNESQMPVEEEFSKRFESSTLSLPEGAPAESEPISWSSAAWREREECVPNESERLYVESDL